MGIGVQLHYKTDLSAEDYVSTQDWKRATLAACPNHPSGGCSLSRNGTYGRKTPNGCRIARYYCRESHATFSLLPAFLAARMPGTLQAAEDAAALLEETGSLQAAAVRARPGWHVHEAGARRWTGCRARRVHLALKLVVTLLPELFRCAPEVAALRARLGTDRLLTDLRGLCAGHLQALPPPFGFRPPDAPANLKKTRQHCKGHDPPPRFQ